VTTGEPPLVSVVMPVWRPQVMWLRLAVASALAQRDCPLELVVVDDGNPEPVEALLDPDPRLRVVRVPHGGVSAARNVGFAATRGPLVRFMDADDAFERGSSARLAALTGLRRGVIAYGATAFCDEKLRPVWIQRSRVEGDARVACALGRFAVRHTSIVFPRAVLEAAGPWDTTLTVAEDWELLQRALEHAPVRGERAVATLYRRAGGSATADHAAGDLGHRAVVERYLERHPDQRRRLEGPSTARLDAIAARVDLTHGRTVSGLQHAWSAARRHPPSLWAEAELAAPALRGRLGRRLRDRAS
jgi:glycosyltransferase involved in cell wall biosynthesis